MFYVHNLSIDVLSKIRSSINYIIIRKEKNRYQSQNDVFFNILSLADQLHRLKSIYSKGLEYDKIHFSENWIPNLLKLGLNHLFQAVKAYKEADRNHTVHEHRAFMLEDRAENEVINKLFRQVKEDVAVIFNLIDLFK